MGLEKKVKREDGFTLLETLVAFMILSISIGTTLQITNLNSIKIQKASEYSNVKKLVQIIRSTTLYDANNIQRSAGTTEQGFLWSLTPITVSSNNSVGDNDAILMKLKITPSDATNKSYSFIFSPNFMGEQP